MRSTSVRLAAAGLAGALACWLTQLYLRDTPLYQYGFEWFLKLSPGEARFYLVYGLAGGVAVFVLALALRPLLTRSFAILSPALTSVRLLWALSALGAALAALIGFGLLRNQVVTDDEYVYLFQSRLLLMGRGSVPPPPLPLFFTNVFIGIQEGRWFGQYPPGHPLVLTPALLVGVPRLMPVLLVGVNLFLTGLLARRLFGPAWGTAAALLLVTSPLYLLTGATLLSHVTAYFALVLASYAAFRTTDPAGIGWSFLAGTGIGLLFLTRPWTGITLGIFPALILLRNARKRGRIRLLVPALAALAVCAACFLVYNRDQTGHALLTGYDALRRRGGQIEFGFGPIIPGVYAHTLVRGLRNLVLLIVRFHFWAWPWPIALLPLVFALRGDFGPASKDPALVRGAAWMFAVGFLAYVPYWSIGVNDTGPVKTYELLLPFTVLTLYAARRWALARGPAGPAAWGIAAFLIALVLFWPVMIAHLDRLSAGVAAPLEAIERGVETPAVVFVRDPGLGNGQSWVFGRPNPRPDLSDAILLVRDLGPADRELLRMLPGRYGYQVELLPGDFRVRPIPQ
jgi:Dolichyl-phosphate-mannose-protein mannosyltransferase